jgi:membrane protein
LQHAIQAWVPFADDIVGTLSLYRVVPAFALFGTIYVLFLALTPSRYRKRGCHKWPGALLITIWWLATVELLPEAIRLVGGYDLTYGSLASVMIALIFFFMVGLGVVAGAELNAALAEVRPTALKGEIYSGPFKDELEVEEPQPGEDVVEELETKGQQL